MKNSEIKQLTFKELNEQIDDEKRLYTKLTLSHMVSQLDNPMKLKKIRKNIARLVTEKRSRELTEKHTDQS